MLFSSFVLMHLGWLSLSFGFVYSILSFASSEVVSLEQEANNILWY